MARSLVGLLILLVPVAAGVSLTDAAGDVSGSTLSEVTDQPAVDILAVDGTATEDGFELAMRLNGTLPIGDQAADENATHRFSYLFVVALGAEPGDNVYQHLDAGRDAITATCHFHQGRADLSCRVTQGDATLRGRGAWGHNVTLALRSDVPQEYALAAIAHESIGEPSDDLNRSIIAQDFTDNALPYQTDAPPGMDDDGFVAAPDGEEPPWWKTPWPYVIGALAALAVVAWFRTGSDRS